MAKSHSSELKSAELGTAGLQKAGLHTAEDVIAWAIDSYGRDIAISTSLQKGGMAVLDIALRYGATPHVFTLDTGRLPEETYAMMETVRRHFGVNVETVSPEAAELEHMIEQHGPNLFYQAKPLRMLCCQVRKARPLARKLLGLPAFMTGLRRDQSETRAAIEQVEESPSLEKIVKINPLAFWSAQDVDEFTALHGIPVHPLYARGYTSIGCAPCTRALSSEDRDDIRAGRWWWEDESAKECGIHFTPDGRAQRTVDVLLNDILTHA